MATFNILPDAQEDELHGQRLLRVEERPFERIKSRLLGTSTPFYSYLIHKSASSSADTGEAAGEEDNAVSKENQLELSDPEQHAKFTKSLQRFREDVILEFAGFEASIARIQFLRDANEKERQRYTAEKLKIEATAQDVRDDTARLKVRLEESKRTLEIRKGYDVLAETITKDARLKPRDEQDANIERLKLEIEELKNEGLELENAWIERREQFVRVVEEGKRLRRIVRDEKDPEQDDKADAEREREGEEGNESDRDEDMLGAERHRDDGSNVGTPRPGGDEDAPTPLPAVHESGAMTPRSTLADAEISTPRPDTTVGASNTGPVEQYDQDINMHEQEGGSSNQVQNIPQVKIDDEMDTS